MRALRVPRFALMSQASLMAAASSHRWCATTEAKPEEKEASNNEEKLGAEKAEETMASAEQVAEVEEQLESSNKMLEELRKELQYRTSDAENARRIGREDVEKAKLFGITSFGKDVLEVGDTLDKGVEAFAKIPAEELAANKALASICTGVKLSLKVLHNGMSKHGIEKMGVKPGVTFDFNLHDALARMPANEQCPHDTICHVLKDGYTIKNRVLRAAQVAVSFDESQ